MARRRRIRRKQGRGRSRRRMEEGSEVRFLGEESALQRYRYDCRVGKAFVPGICSIEQFVGSPKPSLDWCCDRGSGRAKFSASSASPHLVSGLASATNFQSIHIFSSLSESLSIFLTFFRCYSAIVFNAIDLCLFEFRRATNVEELARTEHS